LWLLMVFIVLEEVAMADLFRTIAMDVLDVRITEVDVVDSKLEGEEDKMMVLLLVMMLQLTMHTVLLLMSMVLLLMSMVPLLLMKAQLTMTMKQVVPLLMKHMVLLLQNMELQLMLMVLLPLMSMVLLLMKLMLALKVQLLVVTMTMLMTMLRSLLMPMLLLKPLHQLMRKQDVDVLVEDLAALAGLQQPKRAVLDVPELLARDPLLPERHLDVVSRQIGLHLLLGGSKSRGVDVG